MRKHLVALLFLLLPLAHLRAQNPTDFSIDRLSPEVTRFKVGDLILFDGSGIALDVTMLGLPAMANVDAFSYGKDRLVPFGPGFFVALDFSVSRQSLGAGGAVSAQVALDSAAGDKFRMYILRSGRSIGPFLESNSDKHGLTKPGPVQSNIDGLSFVSGPKMPIFWSVDIPTAQALGLDAATIYVTKEPGVSGYQVYRSRAQMQLPALEDIDGLAVADGGTVGAFDAADVVYISLTGSATRAGYCGGAGIGNDCVIQIEPTRGPGLIPPGRMVVTNAQLDLVGTPNPDQLDAFTGVDPGPCLDSLPPPPRQQQPPPRQANEALGRTISSCIARHNARVAPRR